MGKASRKKKQRVSKIERTETCAGSGLEIFSVNETKDVSVWFLKALAIVTVFVVSVLLGYRQIFSPDIGFYLEIGRRILETGHIPFQEELTYSAHGNAIPYAPWLFCVGSWLLYHIGGTLLLVILKIVVTLAFLGVLAWTVSWRLGRFCGWILGVVFLFVLANHWEYRPHQFSWLFLGLVLLCLDLYGRGTKKALWCMPVIMALWVNMHSLFVLGLAVMGIHLLSDLILRRKLDWMLLKWSVLSGLACFLTPYFQTVALYPLTQFEILRSGLVKSAAVGTQEFRSPFSLYDYTWSGRFVLYQPQFFMHCYLALVCLGWMIRFRRIRLVEWLLLLAFGYVFCQAVKNFGYFFIVTFPVTVCGLGVAAERIRNYLRGKGIFSRIGKWWPQLGYLALTLACVIVGIHVVNGYFYGLGRASYRWGHRFNESALPVRACESIKRLGLKGKILNNWDTGGYLSFATRRPVFIYGWNELMGEEFYREYLKFKDIKKLPRELDIWKQNIALVPFNDIPQWNFYFLKSNQWKCVYEDDRDMLFVRGALAEGLSIPSIPSEIKDYGAYASEGIDEALRKGAKREMPNFWESLVKKHYEPRKELRFTAVSLLKGEWKQCVAYGLAGLEKASFPAPEIYINIGHAFYELKDYKRARFCYETALRRLEDSMAQKRLVTLTR